MDQEKRDFHKRMNGDITAGLNQLRHEFDVSEADIRPDLAEWQILRAHLKDLLLAAYARNHPWIADA